MRLEFYPDSSGLIMLCPLMKDGLIKGAITLLSR